MGKSFPRRILASAFSAFGAFVGMPLAITDCALQLQGCCVEDAHRPKQIEPTASFGGIVATPYRLFLNRSI
jgi:hypothetical protein